MESRRAFLKKLMVLGAGVALPSVAARTGVQAAVVRRTTGAPRSQAPAGLSSQQLAGQRVIFSYPGPTVPAALLDQIAAGQAAGVIFFADNIVSDAQIAGVIQQLSRAQQQSPVPSPLLLMTDQEGGLVRRLPGAPESSAKQVGQSANPGAAASQAGTGAGQNLAGRGMNVNLAPVLGVYRQAGDFLDQYQRSFSQNGQTVATCGQAFISAQQQTGVAATAKHFPGLGTAGATQNTDLGPVTLPVSLSTLRSVDEAPYSAAIAAGVKLIMTSWAVYPALDATYPAGLSATIVQGELRGRLGYQGVTITDALEAGALGSFGTTAQRAVLAARAGMDLILCSARDVSQGQAATTALANALDGGQLDAAGFTAAVQRVTALRNGFADVRYFPETGHTVGHGFLAYWNQFGGLPIFGYPLTEEIQQNGVTTQYFERARFEWHPGSDPARYDVLLGLLGDELTANRRTTPPFQPAGMATNPNCTFFPQTGHNLCYGFRSYWQQFGGLPIFGFPISEEFQENGVTVQYFERARFEWHPRSDPSHYDVLLGRLGAEVLAAQSH